jgi:hypothetical protein
LTSLRTCRRWYHWTQRSLPWIFRRPYRTNQTWRRRWRYGK